MTISIKPTASGSTIEQDGSAILSIDASGNLTVPNNLSVTGTAPIPDALSTASGSAPSYSARAWVNFNGTGTVAIRASGNVSSITDNGTGDYTVNFAIAMPDENYDGSGSATDLSDQGLSDLMRVVVPAGNNTGALPYTSNNARIRVNYADQFLTDAELITFSVRR